MKRACSLNTNKDEYLICEFHPATKKNYIRMKQLLFILGLALFSTGVFTSCKESTLDTLRENEIAALDKYVKDNNLGAKDVSGIYFKHLIEGTGDSIKSGYKLMLFFDITLLDCSAIMADGFTTHDGDGHHFEQYPFYVDVNDAALNQRYIQQIAGIHAGLKKMKVGGKAFMVIPSELAFKAVDNSSIGIPRFSTLLATITVKEGYSPEQMEE